MRSPPSRKKRRLSLRMVYRDDKLFKKIDQAAEIVIASYTSGTSRGAYRRACMGLKLNVDSRGMYIGSSGKHYAMVQRAVRRSLSHKGISQTNVTTQLPDTPDIGDNDPECTPSTPVSTAAESLTMLRQHNLHSCCQEHEQPSQKRGSPSPKPDAIYVEQRIDALRSIHYQEWSDQKYLDPSWCDSPCCVYSSGELWHQRLTLMKRLYQINVALHGRPKKKHLNGLELLKTLI